MQKIISPLDSKGFYRRRQCSYLVNNTLKTIELICSNQANSGKLCCFKKCPILSPEGRETQLKIRERLIHIAPALDNPKISFTNYYTKGRIEISRGIRLIDWDGKKWDVFEKEGATWGIDNFSDDDFEILNDALN